MGLYFPQHLWLKPDCELLPLDHSTPYLEATAEPIYVINNGHERYVANSGQISFQKKDGFFHVLAFDTSQNQLSFGSEQFIKTHGLKYPYVAGGMANGIASVEMVVELAKAGLLGFFGTGGLDLERVEEAIISIQNQLNSDQPYGINMISLNPTADQAVIDLLLKYDVRKVEIGGAITLTPAVVEYRLIGVHRNKEGKIIAPNKIFAKISREEIAGLFMSPPPEKIVQQILQAGRITASEAELAKYIPMSEDLIAEADSGGHTDNRPALLLYQNMINYKNQFISKYKYKDFEIRVGAAGGISTPSTVLAALTLGADFVLTGSINHACIEADTSKIVKEMLSKISMSDVATAPSADMFEMGSRVQVMTKGVMFHLKANKLYELYKNYKSFDEIPEHTKEQVEKRTFRNTFEDVWEMTKKYLSPRSPEMVEKAEKNPKVKMGLVFRWYLGLSSKWAQKGDMERKVDFQILCGPGMGAFNRWAKGTDLEEAENRNVVDVAFKLIHGAQYLRRIQSLKIQGIDLRKI